MAKYTMTFVVEVDVNAENAEQALADGFQIMQDKGLADIGFNFGYANYMVRADGLVIDTRDQAIDNFNSRVNLSVIDE